MVSRDATTICKYTYSTSFDVKKTSSILLFFPHWALPTLYPAGSQNRRFFDTHSRVSSSIELGSVPCGLVVGKSA
jgi:hypothetical protein